jgi:hypothetical protein
MSVARALARLALALGALAVAGCEPAAQWYEGPRRPFAETARLCCRTSSPHTVDVQVRNAQIRIDRIDARWFDFDEAWAELLPGRHEVAYTYVEGTGGFPLPVLPSLTVKDKLAFTALAGHSYLIRARREADKTYVWIEDESTAQVIAGVKPD